MHSSETKVVRLHVTTTKNVFVCFASLQVVAVLTQNAETIVDVNIWLSAAPDNQLTKH